MVEVFRGNLFPYYIKQDGKENGTYIRIGSTNRKADKITIIELERQKENIGFDEEKNLNFDISDLDLSVIYDEFAKIGKNTDYEKLKNLKLINSY